VHQVVDRLRQGSEVDFPIEVLRSGEGDGFHPARVIRQHRIQ
jgi:hypothetical protein